MKFTSDIFGENGQDMLNTLFGVVENIDITKYQFMSHKEHELLMYKDFYTGLKQYWVEILFRAHFASVASIYRNYQWVMGMESSYKNNLFLPYTACFRALIESAADTFDSFNGVPVALAKNNKQINKIITGKYKKKVGFVSKELEDKLIHFSHARRVGKKEDVPDSHQAKSAAKYINSLDKNKSLKLYECYSELCEYTHPAASSTGNFMSSIDENTFVFSTGFDKDKIIALSSKYSDAIEVLLSCAFNPGLITLKLLRKLSEPTCQVPIVDQIGVGDMPLWKECIKHFK
ncbi:hypothetical protein C942_02486 [Photobacterium marinum]|uniref:Uncharacterized protein n=1 Tax=Photobacterium marinum TaxID=1056511 RepID=L8JAH4_9GAMM|nr:hypothetical protein [Photobacterium marinum]ELR64462.1 hypothetical protein C942_02486 [Photobacterium marinum]